MEPLKRLLPWALWLWICLAILGAFLYTPRAEGFVGESNRILFFHVPLAWTAFVAFVVAAVWSVVYLMRGEKQEHDRAAAAAVELGFVFCLLATVTGALWARVQWGAFWNWDPRQTSILLVLVFYGAYLVLRGAVDDRQLRARLAAVYAILGVFVTPIFFFVVPRVTWSLHPDSVINTRGTIDMDSRIWNVLLASWIGFQALFFWIHRLRCRIWALAERN